MPLVPSHQGLIAPLWRRWPDHFNVIALCIGAAIPDVLDGAGGLLFRGHLGQWYGHTLWGAHVLGLPLGLLLVGLSVLLAHAMMGQNKRKLVARFGAWIQSGNTYPPDRGLWGRLVFLSFSLWIGCLSHLFFDVISHKGFKLLQPWYQGPGPIPAWWRATWFTISPPGYTNYSFGPHFLMWIFLSVVGLVLLLWPYLKGSD